MLLEIQALRSELTAIKQRQDEYSRQVNSPLPLPDSLVNRADEAIADAIGASDLEAITRNNLLTTRNSDAVRGFSMPPFINLEGVPTKRGPEERVQEGEAHTEEPVEEEEEMFNCDLCGKQFNRLWNLKMHISTHDEEEQTSETPEIVSQNSDRDNRKPPIFNCPQCENEIGWHMVLNSFLGFNSEQNEIKCHHCNFMFSPNSQKMEEWESSKYNNMEAKPHKCNTCHLSTSTCTTRFCFGMVFWSP